MHAGRRQHVRLLFPYVPYLPHPKQALFLSDAINGVEEVLYGGAAGGGKSDAILMAAMQYIDVPGYAALILRKSFRQLKQPGSILDRAHKWLRRTMYVKDENGVLRAAATPHEHQVGKSLVDWGLCRWNAGDYRYEFPSGATLTFGHLQNDEDWENYQGPEYQFIAFDELTQFNEDPYTKLNTRLRKPEGPTDTAERQAALEEAERTGTLQLWMVPLRMRAGTNPGGRGHAWVKRRFIGDTKRGIPREEATARFISAKLEDNPTIGISYERMLAKTDPVTFRQMRHGSWEDVVAGEYFQRTWYHEVDEWEVRGTQWVAIVRYWDLAATKVRKRKNGNAANDPDWAVGALVAYDGFHWYILDITRLRNEPAEVEKRIVATAAIDGPGVPIWVEQEPGASGKMYVNSLARRLHGHAVAGHSPTGSKLTRAKVVSSKVRQSLVRVVRARWNTEYYDEAEAFTGIEGEDEHDDQVDAVSGAFDRLGGAGAATDTDSTMPDDEDEDLDDDDW